MNITPRKLQKLGASSLVVTLPHTWIEAHGLKAGDVIYIVDEGDRLKIVPANTGSDRNAYEFEAYKLVMPQLVSWALTCLYVNNVNEATIDLRGMGPEAMQVLKEASMRLLGLELLEVERDRAVMKIVLDDSKADPKHAIKGLGSAVSNIAELLRQVAEGVQVAEDQFSIATNELTKYQHLIMRYVVGSMNSGSAEGNLQGTIVGTALLGVVGNTLLDAAKMASRLEVRSRVVSQLASQVRDLAPLVSAMVAQPSVKRLHEVAFNVVATISSIESYIKSSQGAAEAAIIAKVDDAIKTMAIVFMTILCGAVMGEEYLKPSTQ
ncbi:AbrB/MazE/SpoVT family DNA-binding domain-containing protein [Acidilobus sp.]|uniref:AbrB/MazE/SpoVT family DNA-binding domain-containing protein n=1 Tax=Acidilobus sp. TaxID=1872109 RepID=UPI003D0216F9